MAQPQSTTEFLKYIPGFTRVESSGGYVNENYTMRGLYSTIFINFMEDGLPDFPTQNIFFMNTDNLFRIDDNVQRVEVVRGGSAGIVRLEYPCGRDQLNFKDRRSCARRRNTGRGWNPGSRQSRFRCRWSARTRIGCSTSAASTCTTTV